MRVRVCACVRVCARVCARVRACVCACVCVCVGVRAPGGARACPEAGSPCQGSCPAVSSSSHHGCASSATLFATALRRSTLPWLRRAFKAAIQPRRCPCVGGRQKGPPRGSGVPIVRANNRRRRAHSHTRDAQAWAGPALDWPDASLRCRRTRRPGCPVRPRPWPAHAPPRWSTRLLDLVCLV